LIPAVVVAHHRPDALVQAEIAGVGGIIQRHTRKELAVAAAVVRMREPEQMAELVNEDHEAEVALDRMDDRGLRDVVVAEERLKVVVGIGGFMEAEVGAEIGMVAGGQALDVVGLAGVGDLLEIDVGDIAIELEHRLDGALLTVRPGGGHEIVEDGFVGPGGKVVGDLRHAAGIIGIGDPPAAPDQRIEIRVPRLLGELADVGHVALPPPPHTGDSRLILLGVISSARRDSYHSCPDPDDKHTPSRQFEGD
jgi:hypothetical protein